MRHIDSKDLLAQLLPAVRAAGDAIMAIYRRGSWEVSHKADSSLVTEGDLASHRVLVRHLAQLPPGCQVVSEEDPASLAHRQSAGSFWLIDPLDGTKEFIARTGEFMVNVAFIEEGR
jgi:3'(2'), 5'-bisphosphate nucleotidase